MSYHLGWDLLFNYGHREYIAGFNWEPKYSLKPYLNLWLWGLDELREAVPWRSKAAPTYPGVGTDDDFQ
jgi:hypothetical protein